MARTGWQFWVDRGGTFTDVIGYAPDQTLQSLKLLSDNREHYPDATAEGIRRILASVSGMPIIDEIRMGTTVATNALLERAGARTGLLITRGHKDALRIGYQNRPAIFDLDIQLPKPLYESVYEVDERIDAAGNVLAGLDEPALQSALEELHQSGVESVAICFMHSWINPEHEKRAAELARAVGFQQVSSSHEVSPLLKLVSRGTTTVADAYLSPVLGHYVESFQAALQSHGMQCARILFMQSNGGLVTADLFRGKDSILSGPAGGVTGMGAAAARANETQLIGFDMGGTSTDVAVYAGRPELTNEATIAGVHMRTPMICIHTIAAGGGSQLNYASGRFQVGPMSAGADPGPACYGRGGPLTVTDANLLLGRIQADHFPATFGPGADEPLNKQAVITAFAKLAEEISASSGKHYTAEQTATGFLRVAIENMAHAVGHISIQRGLNPADFTLCSFGGAGGQHACQVADTLGMTRILLDPLAGVLSAWGMGAAPLRSYRQRAINLPLNQNALTTISVLISELEPDCHLSLIEQGATADQLQTEVWLELKDAGSDTTISLELGDIENLKESFLEAHTQRFGFAPDQPNIEIESLRLQVETGFKGMPAAPTRLTAQTIAPRALEAMYIDGEMQDTPVYTRTSLPPGCTLEGPAIITEQTGTTVLDSGWTLEVNPALQLILSRAKPASTRQHADAQRDPVMLELMANHFMHIATEMGVVLQRTSRSVNIKERLDFSCALFSPAGELIANAPHIPVHLGSMDDSVKTLLRDELPGLLNGNIYLCNAPYNGGTHLPDLTIISPVLNSTGELLFIVASRAHHADIGGISPGSMPPNSRHIDEEGVVFDNFLLVEHGTFREAELRASLGTAKWPARNPEQNVADCKAQIAANERGRMLLIDMLDRYSTPVVLAYVGHTLDNAEESIRQAISKLGSLPTFSGGTNTFNYPFDNGQEICVAVRIDTDKREAHIDFSGTSKAGDNNLNAPAAVCQAAVMYVFRTLVNADIPLNAGCRRPLHLSIPAGCMLNPAYPAAVVGGNVETSQCITDALYGAMGVLAASQGTMNNLSFGNQQFQYYETICGGAGAGDGFDGADAVQTHMTNSRMTDAEVLELRYPILVREFSVREHSGGAGKHQGGNGVVRRLEFRQAMSAAILSNHRRIPPFGIAGGQNARTGNNFVARRDGTIEKLASIAELNMHEEDVLVIETPGGGGYGAPADDT